VLSGDIAEAPGLEHLLSVLARRLDRPVELVLGNRDFDHGDIRHRARSRRRDGRALASPGLAPGVGVVPVSSVTALVGVDSETIDVPTPRDDPGRESAPRRGGRPRMHRLLARLDSRRSVEPTILVCVADRLTVGGARCTAFHVSFTARLWAPFVAILTVSLGWGCAATATIHRAAAPALDAEIVDSDADAVYVTSESGSLFRIPRREVASVDHPGNVVALVGAVMLALGATVYLAAPGDDVDATRTGALIYGVPGATLVIGGLVSWFRSRSAVGHHGKPTRTDAPTILPADQVVTCPPGASPPGQLTIPPTPAIRLRPVPHASAPADAPQPAAPAGRSGQPPTTAGPPPATTPR